MLYGDQRSDYRKIFFQAWEKHRTSQPLEGIETIIVDVALAHPEYHDILEQKEKYEDKDYLPEMGQTNPFLHMSMHVSILEQLSIDSPRGIRQHFRKLLLKKGDDHETQHLIMECLGEMIWQAQQSRTPPSERVYFSCLKKILESL